MGVNLVSVTHKNTLARTEREDLEDAKSRK